MLSTKQARGKEGDEEGDGEFGGRGGEEGSGDEDGGEREREWEDADPTTVREGWWRGLGRRERYGKLIKNSEDGGREGGGNVAQEYGGE